MELGRQKKVQLAREIERKQIEDLGDMKDRPSINPHSVKLVRNK